MNEVIDLCCEIKSDLQAIKTSLAKLTKEHALKLSESWNRKEEVMTILGISDRTFTRLIHTRKLPFARVNGLIYIKSSDIENLLNENYKN